MQTTPSKVGDRIFVGVVPVKGQMMLCPDVNTREVYFPHDKETFANTCAVGEIWFALVLAVKPIEATRKGPFGLCHGITVQLLRRDEYWEKGCVDRSTRDWVVERKSGTCVLETIRTPARILQKKMIQGNDRVIIERIANKATGETIAEYEHSRINLDALRKEALVKLKGDALLRKNR